MKFSIVFIKTLFLLVMMQASSFANEDRVFEKDGIKLNDFEMGWEKTKDVLGTQKILVHPQVRFSAENTGNEDISRLAFKVVIYLDGRKKVFDDSTAYVISDIPLEPGYSTKDVFLRTSMGYEYNGYNMLAIMKKKYTAKLYYKKRDNWIKFSTYEYL